MVTVTCPRCNGTGNYSYHPQYGTVCFKCDGAKVIEYTDAQYKALINRRNKAAEIKEIKAEEQKAKMLISQQVTGKIIEMYQDTAEFKRRVSNAPDSITLQQEAAIRMFCAEKGIKQYRWIGELAQYI